MHYVNFGGTWSVELIHAGALLPFPYHTHQIGTGVWCPERFFWQKDAKILALSDIWKGLCPKLGTGLGLLEFTGLREKKIVS